MPRSDSDFPHVEIISFTPDRASIISGVVRRLDFTEIGIRQFHVDLIEANGCRMTVWDGTDYEQAIIEAEELAQDIGCGVVDSVAMRTA